MRREAGLDALFHKRRGSGKKSGPPVHDDRVRREFTAPGPNRLWLTDITEHPTGEGELYLWTIKDVWSGRTVGYSIDSRMKSSLAVAALIHAASRRGVFLTKGDLVGTTYHSDRRCNFGSGASSRHLAGMA